MYPKALETFSELTYVLDILPISMWRIFKTKSIRNMFDTYAEIMRYDMS